MVRLKLDQGSLGRFLEQRLGHRLPPAGEPIERMELPDSQLHQVMLDLGRYLARLHAVELEGYGPIKEEVFNQSGKLIGIYKSWYEFLLAFLDEQSKKMDEVREQEEKTGEYITELSQGNRELMDGLLGKLPLVRGIMETHRNLLAITPGRLLNGNIHLGSIFVENGKFSGLGDFGQLLIGDPIDDLAYFSVMPQGERLLPYVRQGWEQVQSDPGIEEKLHLYCLLESYRKIFTRYLKHHYLEDYPEPLRIAQDELRYYTRQ